MIELNYMRIKHNEYKYELLEDYEIFLNFRPKNEIMNDFYSFLPNKLEAILYIKKGYRWDGASGPTVDTHNTIRASCVHDVLYQMIRRKELPIESKSLADEALRRIMLEDSSQTGISGLWGRFRAGYFFYAVKLFGWSACEPGTGTLDSYEGE